MTTSSQQLSAAVTAPEMGSPAKPTSPHAELRAVFGTFATGVTIITSGRDPSHGMTANAFTSVSLDPAMVLVCVKRTSIMHSTILTHGTFAISILASDQEEVARYFANSARPRDDREFQTIPYQPGVHTGLPVITGGLGWIECKLAAVHDGGDHSIFVGSVLDLGHSGKRDALVFHTGRFLGLNAAY